MARQYFDLFRRGLWVGMSEGEDLAEATRKVEECNPEFEHDFCLVPWYGSSDPRNCATSGGQHPDPLPHHQNPHSVPYEERLHG